MALIGGVLWVADMVFIYHYPFLQNPINQTKTVFWICAIATLISAAGALATEKINLNISWTDWLLVLGHTASFAILLISYMYACSVVAGILNALVACTSMAYITLAQYTFMSRIHPGNHNWVEILGVVLVMISSTLPSVVKANKKSRAKAKEDLTDD